mgnify:CR=1 FL=1
MSCLIVQPEHLEDSLEGRKWETRRVWESPRVKIGNSYRLLRAGVDGLFTKREDAPAYAVIEDVRQERLGDIDAESAFAEGGYTVEEFRGVWRDINGEWDPGQLVYVVTYSAVRDDPRDS